jgi:hypothetical protein
MRVVCDITEVAGSLCIVSPQSSTPVAMHGKAKFLQLGFGLFFFVSALCKHGSYVWTNLRKLELYISVIAFFAWRQKF